MKRLTFILAALLLAVTATTTHAADRNTYRSISKKVWGENRPEFQANVILDNDSIYGDAGGVIIARLMRVSTHLIEEPNEFKKSKFGIPNTNAISMTHLDRVMVLLRDDETLDDYSTMTVPEVGPVTIHGYNLGYTDAVLGARVHKPDGRVIESDFSERYDITVGKDNKKAAERVAITGLEKGDVLEYFIYQDFFLDEFDAKEVTIDLMRKLPIKTNIIELNLDSRLSTVYCTYNDAPLLPGTTDNNGIAHLALTITDTPGLNAPVNMVKARQVPYIALLVSNPKARFTFHPQKYLGAGIIPNPPADILMNALGDYISIQDIKPGHISGVTNIVKKWRANHPDATENEVADATWLAMQLYTIDCEDLFDMNDQVLLFAAALEKLKLRTPFFIGAIGNSQQPPIDHRTSYKGANLFVRFGARNYFLGSLLGKNPAEQYVIFDNEDAYMFAGKRKDAATGPIDKIRLPRSKYSDHISKAKLTAKIDPDDFYKFKAHYSYEATGSEKIFGMTFLKMTDLKSAAEDFLGVKGRTDRNVIGKAARATALDKDMTEVANSLIATEIKSISNPVIESTGCLPDEKLRFSLDCEIEDGITENGPDLLLFSIGHLQNPQNLLSERDAKRDIDGMMISPFNRRTDIEIEMPEGFHAEPQSVEDLSMNVANEVGSFYAKARIADDGKLILSINHRLLTPIVPVDKWSEYVALSDAMRDLSTRTVVLTRD